MVVSSGAVAAGGVAARRRGAARLEWRQAAAAVGQTSLMAAYERAFARHERTVAQVLLTHADLADRRRYLNARHTLRALLALGVVPIVNENDTVAVEELKFGDNDNLSALTASLVEADLLVILSDVAGPLHAPIRASTATRAAASRSARADDPRARRDGGTVARPASARAAWRPSSRRRARRPPRASRPSSRDGAPARRAGARSSTRAVDVGTLLSPTAIGSARRKHWIAHTLKPAGTLHLDAGAERALAQGGRSLLPSGVRAVEGAFGVGDCVRCVGPDGARVRRAAS